MVTIDLFGRLPDGREVTRFTIENASGERVELLNYGAMIHAIYVHDRRGQLDDIVLGAPNAKELEICTYLGSTIGRCSNRIANGAFSIGGRQYQLERNFQGHFLHGASDNYAQMLFDWKVFSTENTVCFTHIDSGSCGFGCTAYVEIEYRFSDDSRLTMTTRMVADGDTVFNPTNHTYFDLSCSGDIRGHTVTIYAHSRAARSGANLPNGGSLPVAGTPADFTAPRSLRDAIGNGTDPYFHGKLPKYDEYYLLDQPEYGLAAQVEAPETGRILRLYTDMPCLILFNAAGRAPYIGKHKRVYQGYCGLCLEPSFVPNAVNCPDYISPVFYRGHSLITKTVYAFSSSID